MVLAEQSKKSVTLLLHSSNYWKQEITPSITSQRENIAWSSQFSVLSLPEVHMK